MDFIDAVVAVTFAFSFFAVPLMMVAGIAELIQRHCPRFQAKLERLMGFGDIQPWIE